MGKSRSNRSDRQTSERLRMALLYVFCCGRRGNIEDVEVDKMTIGEEMRKAENIIYSPSKSVERVKHEKTAQNSEDDVIPQKVHKRPAPKRPAPKRPSESPRPTVHTNGPTEQQDNNFKREIDEVFQHGDTLDNVGKEQKPSSSNVKLEVSMSENETKPLEDYPEYLNPFADDDVGHNADGNDGNNAANGENGNNADAADNGNRADSDDAMKDDKDNVKQESTSRTIEDYPEELNPFVDDEDVLQDEGVDAGVRK